MVAVTLRTKVQSEVKKTGGCGVLNANPMELSVVNRPMPAAKRSSAEIDLILTDARASLYRLALAIVAEPNLAEDIAQETLIRADRTRDRLAVVGDPGAWLRKIAVRRAITALRRPTTAPVVDQPVFCDPDLAISVRQTLSALKPVDRSILALAHFEQLSYAQIADLLEIPVGTVGSRLNAARAAFKEAWKE